LSGPHDISKDFDEEATGLHLKEYTNTELRALFMRAGFSDCRCYATVNGGYAELPSFVLSSLEKLLILCPASVRRPMVRRGRFSRWLGVRLAARA
ncbi:MAG: class I SAM-dependent methyltransferase, partial [Gemmatimonadota bacterium]|nr:class I SAM-dependent methyltransferase [Gemmatimonadota bacterium]